MLHVLHTLVYSCDAYAKSDHQTELSAEAPSYCQYGDETVTARIVKPRRCCERYRPVVIPAP